MTHRHQAISFLAIASMLFSATSSQPQACKCAGTGDATQALAASNKVFIGKALGFSEDQKLIRFEVIEAWKGVTTEVTTTVFESPEGGTCAYAFLIGEYYLVFTYNDRTTICSPTKLFRISAHDMALLGRPTYMNQKALDRFPYQVNAQ